MKPEDVIRIARELRIWWADTHELECIAAKFFAAGFAAGREKYAEDVATLMRVGLSADGAIKHLAAGFEMEGQA